MKMFGRVYYPIDRTRYITKTVIEKRAPTDESVRLLKEFEQAANDKIIESIHVRDNSFDAVVTKENDFLSGDIVYRVVFSLNGKRIVGTHRTQTVNMRDAYKELHGIIAERIAHEILSVTFR